MEEEVDDWTEKQLMSFFTFVGMISHLVAFHILSLIGPETVTIEPVLNAMFSNYENFIDISYHETENQICNSLSLICLAYTLLLLLNFCPKSGSMIVDLN